MDPGAGELVDGQQRRRLRRQTSRIFRDSVLRQPLEYSKWIIEEVAATHTHGTYVVALLSFFLSVDNIADLPYTLNFDHHVPYCYKNTCWPVVNVPRPGATPSVYYGPATVECFQVEKRAVTITNSHDFLAFCEHYRCYACRRPLYRWVLCRGGRTLNMTRMTVDEAVSAVYRY